MNYYIRLHGDTYGPYESDAMLGFIREGRVGANSEVSTDLVNWTYTGYVAELFPPAAPQAPTAPVADPYGMADSSNPYGTTDPYGLSSVGGDPYGMQPMGQNEYGLAPTTPSPQPASPYYSGIPGSADVYGTAPAAPSYNSPYETGGGGTSWDNVLGEHVSTEVSSYNPSAASSNPYSPPSGEYREDYQRPKRRRKNTGNEGAAVAALILGIVSICFACCAPIGWITGAIGLSQASQGMDSNSSGMATAGKVLCIIGLVLSTLSGINFIFHFVVGFIQGVNNSL